MHLFQFKVCKFLPLEVTRLQTAVHWFLFSYRLAIMALVGKMCFSQQKTRKQEQTNKQTNKKMDSIAIFCSMRFYRKNWGSSDLSYHIFFCLGLQGCQLAVYLNMPGESHLFTLEEALKRFKRSLMPVKYTVLLHMLLRISLNVLLVSPAFFHC